MESMKLNQMSRLCGIYWLNYLLQLLTTTVSLKLLRRLAVHCTNIENVNIVKNTTFTTNLLRHPYYF